MDNIIIGAPNPGIIVGAVTPPTVIVLVSSGIQGPSSSTTNKRVSSAPISGDLAGVDFTLPFTPGTDSDGNPDVQLFLQGLLLSDNDYSISGTSVTMNYAPIEGPFICSGYKA